MSSKIDLTPANSKAGKRRYFKNLIQEKRQSPSWDDSAVLSGLKKQFQNFFASRQGVWAAFQPLNDEPPVLECVSQFPKITWLYPRMAGEKLEFVLSDRFQAQEWGVKQPQAGSVFSLQQVQGFLVPGLGFNTKGFRLGRGKGFYDRTLAGLPAVKVGVCFDFQMTEDIGPIESHDLKMNYVLSDRQMYDFTLVKG